MATVCNFASRRAFNKSKYTLPLQSTTRVTAAGCTSSISSMTVRKPPPASSSSRDTDSGWRSRLLGVMMMSGLRNGRTICRRSM